MRLELDLVFSTRHELSKAETAAVECIKRLCLETDGFVPGVHFDIRLNAIKSMPSWFLAEARGASGTSRIVGAACVFAPRRSEGEFSACVDPLFRRSGLFARLFSMGIKTLAAAGIPSLLLVSDGRLGYGSAIAAKLGAARSHGDITMILHAAPTAPGFSPQKNPTKASTENAPLVRLVPVSRDELDDLATLCWTVFGDTKDEAKTFMESAIDISGREQYSARSVWGITGLVSLSQKEGNSMVHGLGVEPGLRKKGYGGAILDAVISIERRRGVKALRLEVDETNIPAIALFRSRGFIEESRTEYWRVSLDSLGYAKP